MSSLAKIVKIPTFVDPTGKLGFVQRGATIPFEPRRVYYIFDVEPDCNRGGHAHKELQQLVIALCGNFTVKLFDGFVSEEFNLNSPTEGLLLEPGLWRELTDFTEGSVCLVLASAPYDESDYIRDLNEFTAWVANK